MATSLLLETDPSGLFSHLELSTRGGLLTLHPEGDGTLHGNAVVGGEDSVGIEHVRGIAWQPDSLVLVDGSIICQAAAVLLLGQPAPGWSSTSRSAVLIPATLWLQAGPVRVERVGLTRWRFGDDPPLDVDERGLPVLRDGSTWPLDDGG
jgi:hypothetical protein